MFYISIIQYFIFFLYSNTEIGATDSTKLKKNIGEKHQGQIVKSLFDDESVIKLSLKCDFNEILNDRTEESSYHDAIMQIDTGFYGVKLKTRGIFRRKKSNCALPPLWVKFDANQMAGSVFSGYEKLKLVVPCFNKNAYEQNILKEYLIYKTYNILTNYSFRVRLIKLTIFDLNKRRKPLKRYSFFIEPTEDMCKRLYGKDLNVKNIHPNFTDKKLITLMSVFQYFIGNTDWSVKALHNIKLISRDSLLKPVAIPYDFDVSGLVNAAYAIPAPHLGIQTVRQRSYNGYHRPMAELQEALNVFRSKKEDIYKLVYSVKGLQKKHIDETIKYFDQFYNTLDHTKEIQHEFIEKSRKD